MFKVNRRVHRVVTVNFVVRTVAGLDPKHQFCTLWYNRLPELFDPVCYAAFCFSAKLHYTDTGYGYMLYNSTNGHHQRTSSQQVVDVVHVRSRCPCSGVWALLLRFTPIARRILISARYSRDEQQNLLGLSALGRCA